MEISLNKLPVTNFKTVKTFLTFVLTFSLILVIWDNQIWKLYNFSRVISFWKSFVHLKWICVSRHIFIQYFLFKLNGNFKSRSIQSFTALTLLKNLFSSTLIIFFNFCYVKWYEICYLLNILSYLSTNKTFEKVLNDALRLLLKSVWPFKAILFSYFTLDEITKVNPSKISNKTASFL